MNLPLSEALKKHSRQTHDSVDMLVLSMEPFASIENYSKFLQAQNAFHEVLQPIYENPSLNLKIKGLNSLSRLEQVAMDMQDLHVKTMLVDEAIPSPSEFESIGWLYCSEGSNLGAAILYKEAQKIELTSTHGAKHLSAHKDGRMVHWRKFKEQLDGLELTLTQRQQALKGAEDAFAFFKRVIRQVNYAEETV
ncbi:MULTISPECIES: biliverdin-producing heme oxygenase [unclassified Psychrobacter]|uniref:biliverdin-producing heme oxygenase n=1 Tax=unclassified Psychrobacter TaxID=196806 RepID=UPI0025B34282|nr:biliverdin-producing heme oxygenase [Psychrobacter sp. APC 3350]MDN3454108.1 biliverdin-producing heme oxygenase [Psychrobacter sp. APC 3350]